MILVDTSVWVDHLRVENRDLRSALEDLLVVAHPYVIGELALGNLPNRRDVMSQLERLPSSAVATPEEVLQFIELQSLMGRGIGYVDLHLLAACTLMLDTQIWTRDRRLRSIANDMGLAYES